MTSESRKLKRAFALLLSLLMILGTPFISNATVMQNNEVSPCYVNIDKAFATVSISGIKATCTAIFSSKNSVSLKIKMELQKEKSSGYETVKTWTDSTTGTVLSMSESRNINILYDYRLKTTFTAGSESKVVYSYP